MPPGAQMALASGSMEECPDETAAVPAPRDPPSDRAFPETRRSQNSLSTATASAHAQACGRNRLEILGGLDMLYRYEACMGFSTGPHAFCQVLQINALPASNATTSPLPSRPARQALARIPDRHGKLSMSMMSLSRRTAFVNANHRPSGLTVTFWSGPQS